MNASKRTFSAKKDLASSGYVYDSDPDEDLWPSGNLGKHLCEMEKAFTCGICKGLMCNPQSLPCQHSYCSECISKSTDKVLYMNAQNKCPLCGVDCVPRQFIPNVSLGTSIKAFKQARRDLLDFLHKKSPEPQIVYVQASAAKSVQEEEHQRQGDSVEVGVRSSARKRKPTHSALQDFDPDYSDHDGEMENSTGGRLGGRIQDADYDSDDLEYPPTKADAPRKSSSGPNHGVADHLKPTSGQARGNGRRSGTEITKRVTPYNFNMQGSGGRSKVLKELQSLTAGSRVRPRVDGDEDKLKARYRAIVHRINAQVGSVDALTLDEVISTCNDAETAAEKSARSEVSSRRHLDAMSGSDAGFQKLIAEARRKQREAKASDNASKSAVLAESDFMHSKASSSLPGELGVVLKSAVRATEEEEEEVEEEQEEETDTPPQANVATVDNWQVLYSDKAKRNFYVNLNTGQAQFTVPDELLSTVSAADSAASAQAKTSKTHALALAGAGAGNAADFDDCKRSEAESHSSQSKTFTQADVDADADALQWTCTACTLVNSSQRSSCEVCQTPNPASLRKKTRSSSSNNGSSGNGGGMMNIEAFRGFIKAPAGSAAAAAGGTGTLSFSQSQKGASAAKTAKKGRP